MHTQRKEGFVTRDYELGFILNPEVSEEDTRAMLNRVEQIVANHNGQIVRVQQWGRRRLAYPIQHHRDGFYIFIDMILTPETVSELERTLKVSEVVLRYMTRRRDPKAVQQEREARANVPATTDVAAQSAAPETSQAHGAQEEREEQNAQPETQTDQDGQTGQISQEDQANQESELAQPVDEQATSSDEGAVATPTASDASETVGA
jgi:small subunit ribosomal protein S6